MHFFLLCHECVAHKCALSTLGTCVYESGRCGRCGDRESKSVFMDLWLNGIELNQRAIYNSLLQMSLFVFSVHQYKQPECWNSIKKSDVTVKWTRGDARTVRTAHIRQSYT